MKIEFRENVNRRYMAVRIEEPGALRSSYVFRMASENGIGRLLTFTSAVVDGTEQFCYDVTGLTALSSFLAEHPADAGLIRDLVRSLGGVMDELQSYLIGTEYLMVHPDRIFIDPLRREFRFGLFPVEEADRKKDLLKLSELLLSRLPQKDREAAEMGYALYRAGVSGRVTAEELRRIGSTLMPGGKDPDSYPGAEREAPFFEAEQEPQFWESMNAPENRKTAKKPKKPGKEPARSGKKKEIPSGRPPFREKMRAFWIRITTDHSELKRQKRQKEAKEDLDFFRAYLDEREEKNFRRMEESPGTVLVTPRKDEERPGTFVLIPKDLFSGEDIPVQGNECRIGRSRSLNDIRIEHATVSRRHARLIRRGDSYEIVDEGSRNGTKVNGHFIPKEVPFRLSDGDELAFAEAEYYFHARTEQNTPL